MTLMERPDNPRFPHTCIISRPSDNGAMEDDTTSVTIYSGECRAYEKNTTSDRGEIITSVRGLSVPVTLDGWTELGVCPREGDLVEVTRGAYTEYGTVVDKNPGNFGGTHIIWRYGRE